MEIIVDITRDDYWHFNKLFMRRHMVTKPQLLFFAILIGIVLFLAAVLSLLRGDFGWILEVAESWTGSVLHILFMILGLCILLLVFVLLLTKRFVKKVPSDKSGTLGEHQIRIAEDGIHEKTAVSEGMHKWSAVTDILQDNDYLFLFVDRMQAHIIPKRSFTRPNDAEEFFKKSMALWKSTTT